MWLTSVLIVLSHSLTPMLNELFFQRIRKYYLICATMSCIEGNYLSQWVARKV